MKKVRAVTMPFLLLAGIVLGVFLAVQAWMRHDIPEVCLFLLQTLTCTASLVFRIFVALDRWP